MSRRTVQGYVDFGSIILLPVIMLLTDRDDGTIWLLSHNTAQGPDADGRISINDTFTLPAKQAVHLYPAFEGPILDDVRLLVRGGHLGYERARGLDGGKAVTRVPPGKTAREIFVQATWDEGEPLSWRPIEV